MSELRVIWTYSRWLLYTVSLELRSVCIGCVCSVVCFFKQKTAYELRSSDWSSDVCSSDLHNFAGLRVPYGEDGARNIISLTNTKIMLRTTDRDTAEECSRLIGFRKVRTMDESYSYGAHQTRDASTISPTTKEEALVIADDRSEEHTSALQSLMRIAYDVFCLKKKN